MARSLRNPFGLLMNEVSQIQDDFTKLFGRLNPYPASAAGTGLLINVWEDENALYAEADLPDLDPAKLDVSVTEGNQLLIQGERKAPEIKGATWVRQERPYGPFVRVIGLPSLIDSEKVDAKYDNGVLRLVLPKSEAAKPRKITVTAGE